MPPISPNLNFKGGWLFRVKTLYSSSCCHGRMLLSAPWGDGTEARGQQMKRERLEGRRVYPGAQTAVDVPRALVSTAPSAGLGSRQVCQALPGLGRPPVS